MTDQLGLMDPPTVTLPGRTVSEPLAKPTSLGERERAVAKWWVALDTETTAPEPEQARVVTCSVVLMLGNEPMEGHDWLVDAGVDIPAEAAAVHGWTTEKLRAEPSRISTEEFHRQLMASLKSVFDGTYPLVIFNACYDLTVLRAEAERTGHTFPETGYTVVDPLVIDRRFDKWRKGGRKLTDIAAHYGVDVNDLDLGEAGAHSANWDAILAGRLGQAVVRKWCPDLSFPELHAMQSTWQNAWRNEFNQYQRGPRGKGYFQPPGWPFLSRTQG